MFTLGGNSVRVPNVVNSSIGVAQEKLDESSLNPIISGREVSETVPANMVLRQGVDAGSVVEKGTEVDLYISAAPEIEVEPGLMPDLSYYTEAEAQSALDNLGAETHVEYEYSNDVAEGLVIRSSIGYGEPLPENEPVTLYVSKGPDPAAKEESSDDEANETVKLNRSSLSLFVGDSVSLSASGGDGSFNWSSSNPAVASVEKGTVTAVGKGSAIITVTSDGSSTDCTVTVQDYSISLSNTELNMFEGESQSLAVYGVPSGGSVSWNSSNSSVATVTGGTVTAVSNGNSTITAQVTISGRTFSNTCVVNVTSGGISLSKTNVELFPGGSETISATTTPSGRSVTWSSSDTSVATVSGGKITAVSAGSTKITASFTYAGKSYSQSCSVVANHLLQPSASPEKEPQPDNTLRFWNLQFQDSHITLTVGSEYFAMLNPYKSSGEGEVNLYWRSSNTSVVQVSTSEKVYNSGDGYLPGGSIKAVGVGNATVTMTIDSTEISYDVIVTEEESKMSCNNCGVNEQGYLYGTISSNYTISSVLVAIKDSPEPAKLTSGGIGINGGQYTIDFAQHNISIVDYIKNNYGSPSVGEVYYINIVATDESRGSIITESDVFNYQFMYIYP